MLAKEEKIPPPVEEKKFIGTVEEVTQHTCEICHAWSCRPS